VKREHALSPRGYALVLGLLAALPLDAQAPKGKRSAPDPWSECEVGSWIILRESMSVGGKVKESKEKHERVAGKLGGADVSVSLEADGKFGKEDHVRSYLPNFLPKPVDAKNTRREILTIGGKRIICTRTEYLKDFPTEGFKATLILWCNPEVKVPSRKLTTFGGNVALPGDVVRAEYSFKLHTDSGTHREEVISLAEDLKVGSRTVKCVVARLRFEEQGNDIKIQGESRVWLSADVPGHQVRVTAAGTWNGMRFRADREVLDFKAVKRRR
jgi:hypothetical protein